MKLLESADDWLKWLFGEGGWTLVDREHVVVDAVIKALPEDCADTLSSQLKHPFFMERIGGDGRMNHLFFDDVQNVPPIDRPEFAGIAAMTVPDQGLGRAINDRLNRAAAPR